METFHSWSEASKAEALLLVERGVESRIPSEPSNTGTPDAGGAALAISMSRMCSCVCVCVFVCLCVCVCVRVRLHLPLRAPHHNYHAHKSAQNCTWLDTVLWTLERTQEFSTTQNVISFRAARYTK
jgi:hypothetical protein